MCYRYTKDAYFTAEGWALEAQGITLTLISNQVSNPRR